MFLTRDKMLKEVLKDFLNNQNCIPAEFLRWEIFYVVDLNDEKFRFGIRKNGNIVLEDKKGRKNYTFKTFFLKPRVEPCVEKTMIETLKEYLLFKKLKNKTLRAKEIMNCRNAEIRRALLERFGYEKFLAEIKGFTIHSDGNSRLVKIEWKNEEPIKLVKVKDSSTDRFYVLRVPPNVKTCREAVAWTFGLTKEEYKPIKET